MGERSTVGGAGLETDPDHASALRCHTLILSALTELAIVRSLSQWTLIMPWLEGPLQSFAFFLARCSLLPTFSGKKHSPNLSLWRGQLSRA
jgi:hypothetical protein